MIDRSIETTPRPRRKPSADGRRLRSERTRQRIIDAYLDLLRESPLVPTAAQIARRAGCSTRSIFERFPDMLTLSFAAADQSTAKGLAQATVHQFDGDRPTRIRSHVETRSDVCEQWLPLWRALLHNQHESELLKQRIGKMRDMITARLELMYRPELATLPEPDCFKLLVALEALIDFESWGRMRERHGLSVTDAREVWIAAIDRLLPPTPPPA